MMSRVLQRIMGEAGPGGTSLDSLLTGFDRELENFQSLEQPAPESKPRTPFDSPHLNRSPLSLDTMSSSQFLKVLPVMAPLMRQMNKSAGLYDGKFQPTRSEATPEFIQALESKAYSSGACDIRYVRVPANAIFAGLGIPHKYAILITIEMDKDNLSGAPSFEAFLEVARGYKNLAKIANRLSGYLRANGFAGYPGTALGGLTDSIYLAELSGLGATGYHGLLISPGQGARLRIATVYTNITNLPLQQGNDFLWVRDFCAMCRKCVRRCPVGAIFDEPLPRGDGGFQCIDHALCRDYFNMNYGCAICLIQCPFSLYSYDKIKASFKGNPGAPQYRISQTGTESPASLAV